jgi:hypothetical protein
MCCVGGLFTGAWPEVRDAADKVLLSTSPHKSCSGLILTWLLTANRQQTPERRMLW